MFYDDKGPKFMTRAQFDKLPEDEKSELRKEIMDVHDRVLDVFKGIPSNLLLIYRYSNLYRLLVWVLSKVACIVIISIRKPHHTLIIHV